MLPDGYSRYPWWRRLFGRQSERMAIRYLRKQRIRVLARNIEDRRGEIDLLALDGETLVFVEVRSSSSRTLNQIAATVDFAKQKQVAKAAARYIQRRRLQGIPVRFDVIAIRRPADGSPVEIGHYRHAFQSTGRYQMEW